MSKINESENLIEYVVRDNVLTLIEADAKGERRLAIRMKDISAVESVSAGTTRFVYIHTKGGKEFSINSEEEANANILGRLFNNVKNHLDIE